MRKSTKLCGFVLLLQMGVAHLTKGIADYDDIFQVEPEQSDRPCPVTQLTALVEWPSVCNGGDDGRPPRDDGCCVPIAQIAIVATSTSRELCSDGIYPVTIVYTPEKCDTRGDVQLIRYVAAIVDNPTNGKSRESCKFPSSADPSTILDEIGGCGEAPRLIPALPTHECKSSAAPTPAPTVRTVRSACVPAAPTAVVVPPPPPQTFAPLPVIAPTVANTETFAPLPAIVFVNATKAPLGTDSPAALCQCTNSLLFRDSIDYHGN